MNETEFIERWQRERKMYEAWGNHVAECIIAEINSRIPAPACDLLLRMPVQRRVKGESSFLAKAFMRKSYDNPYNDITDKVGIRFVVLLGKDINEICNIIENSDTWSFSRDRDVQKDQETRPIQFEYAAVHYVVRCASDTQVGQYLVPSSTPCEIQIKTMLQHAWSELTHDTIYKPNAIVSPEIRRDAAKSMALLEATGDYFDRIIFKLNQTNAPARNLSSSLEDLYRMTIGQSPEKTSLEGAIIDAVGAFADGEATNRIKALLIDKPFIVSKIIERVKSSILFRQPAILLLYLLAYEQPDALKDNCPILFDDIRPIFRDLGIAFDGI